MEFRLNSWVHVLLDLTSKTCIGKIGNFEVDFVDQIANSQWSGKYSGKKVYVSWSKFHWYGPTNSSLGIKRSLREWSLSNKIGQNRKQKQWTSSAVSSLWLDFDSTWSNLWEDFTICIPIFASTGRCDNNIPYATVIDALPIADSSSKVESDPKLFTHSASIRYSIHLQQGHHSPSWDAYLFLSPTYKA